VWPSAVYGQQPNTIPPWHCTPTGLWAAKDCHLPGTTARASMTRASPACSSVADAMSGSASSRASTRAPVTERACVSCTARLLTAPPASWPSATPSIPPRCRRHIDVLSTRPSDSNAIRQHHPPTHPATHPPTACEALVVLPHEGGQLRHPAVREHF